MSKRTNQSLKKRLAIDVAGFGLIILSPFLGWLPGPGGIPMFLAGLGILALNYDWAERHLKEFDKNRLAITEKYLVGNKKVARTIDGLALAIIIIALWIFTMNSHWLTKLITLGTISFGVIILISNQKRFDRAVAYFKRRYHKRK